MIDEFFTFIVTAIIVSLSYTKKKIIGKIPQKMSIGIPGGRGRSKLLYFESGLALIS